VGTAVRKIGSDYQKAIFESRRRKKSRETVLERYTARIRQNESQGVLEREKHFSTAVDWEEGFAGDALRQQDEPKGGRQP